MNCSRCGLELKSVTGLPGLRRIVYPHVCKPQEKRFTNVSAVAEALSTALGIGPDWALPKYGEYYANSVSVYAAIKMRAENVVRPPLVVNRVMADGTQEPVEPEHPLQLLLTKVNPFWTRGDLWRATSTYLDLWGSCYWHLKKSGPDSLPTEIWPLRPDRVRIIPDKTAYIAGYVYEYNQLRQPLRPDEVIWFRYFNPQDEWAGFSPIATARLSVDMGVQALRHNEKIFKNGMLWSNVTFNGEGPLTDDQVEDFYVRLKKRFSGTDNSWKPIVTSGMEPKNLGFSQRDLEFIASLNWSMEDVERVYGIPGPLMSLKDVTFANADAGERIFWRQTMVPLVRFLEEEINEMLAPMFGPDLQCEFDLSQIEALQEDRDKKEAREREDIKLGIQTINEVRQTRGLEPVPWGDEPLKQPAQGDVLGAFEEFESIAAPKMADLNGNHGWKLYRKDWSDHALKSAETLHMRALSSGEKEFVTLQRQLFAGQQADIVHRLNSMQSKALVKKALPEFLFDLQEWVRRFKERGRPAYKDNMEKSANAQISLYRLNVNFNPQAEGVLRWLDGRLDLWATTVNAETGKLLNEEIAQGIEMSESIKQLQARVEKVFRFSDVIRSEMIARTETQAAVNHGAYEAYRQSGVVDSKMWLATQDNRTREHHQEAHRQVVPLEARFEVGGELLQHPGDGSAMNAINCRCTVVPVISQRKSMEKQSIQTGEITDEARRANSQNGLS